MLLRSTGRSPISASGVSKAPDRYAAYGDFPWTTDGFARLKGMAAVLEYDMRPDGGYRWRMWEWQ